MDGVIVNKRFITNAYADSLCAQHQRLLFHNLVTLILFVFSTNKHTE